MHSFVNSLSQDDHTIDLLADRLLTLLCSYWLFPVWCAENIDLQKLCAEMTKRGYDITTGATQLGSVEQ